MVKTCIADFLIEGVQRSDDLEYIISNRQSKFNNTAEYKEVESETRELMNKLSELSPEAKSILNKLDAAINTIECISYSAAYMDGMADLMTAMTFNKLHITKVECIDWRDPSLAGEAPE